MNLDDPWLGSGGFIHVTRFELTYMAIVAQTEQIMLPNATNLYMPGK
jgi:hypothetical protein